MQNHMLEVPIKDACVTSALLYQLLVTTVMGSGLSLIVCVINQLVKCYFGQGRVEWQYINVHTLATVHHLLVGGIMAISTATKYHLAAVPCAHNV